MLVAAWKRKQMYVERKRSCAEQQCDVQRKSHSFLLSCLLSFFFVQCRWCGTLSNLAAGICQANNAECPANLALVTRTKQACPTRAPTPAPTPEPTPAPTPRLTRAPTPSPTPGPTLAQRTTTAIGGGRGMMTLLPFDPADLMGDGNFMATMGGGALVEGPAVSMSAAGVGSDDDSSGEAFPLWIIGVIVGVLALCFLAATVVYFVKSKKKKQGNRDRAGSSTQLASIDSTFGSSFSGSTMASGPVYDSATTAMALGTGTVSQPGYPAQLTSMPSGTYDNNGSLPSMGGTFNSGYDNGYNQGFGGCVGGGGGYNQGGYNQGGYDQGGYDQGGYNQGGYNQQYNQGY